MKIIAIKKPEELYQVISETSGIPSFSFDTETLGEEGPSDAVVYRKMIPFCVTIYYPDKCWYIPLEQEFLPGLQKIFSSGAYKIAHNIIFDINVMHKFGVDVIGPYLCSYTLAILVDGYQNIKRNGYSLDTLSESILGTSKTSKDIGKDIRKAIEEHGLDKVIEYACVDSKLSYLVAQKLFPKVYELNLEEAMRIEMDVVKSVAKINRTGIRVDLDYTNNLLLEVNKGLSEAKTTITSYGDININSPKQLRELLYDNLGLSTTVTSKKSDNLSTSYEALQENRGKHPIIDSIIEYRTLEKLRSTYLQVIIDKNVGGIIEASFNPMGATGGRWSCSNPNLQNIPKPKRNINIRNCFIPRDDYVFVRADYSQLELRILAHVSKDYLMCKTFIEGGDIHETTQTALNLPDRKIAKMVNFGIVYGISPYGLMNNLKVDAGIDIPLHECVRYIKDWYKKFSGVASWKARQESFVRANNYITNLVGRRTYFGDYDRNNKGVVGQVMRQSVNIPIQGFAGGDMLKMLVVNIDEELPDVDILATVHDEVILECKQKDVVNVTYKVKEIMEDVITLRVPLIAEVTVEERWN